MEPMKTVTYATKEDPERFIRVYQVSAVNVNLSCGAILISYYKQEEYTMLYLKLEDVEYFCVV